jgi:hypothetical protein
MPDVALAHFGAQASINPPGGYEGPTIASAATITLSHPAHKISGAGAVTTINLPYTGFVGSVTLIALGAFTCATGGNVVSTFTAAANKAYRFYYDGSNWYPPS